jgi:large subunit ribosomal protein L18
MNKLIAKNQKIARRHKRIRSTISGTAERPRMCVFKSNKYVYVQLVDDVAGKTLVSFSSLDAKGKTMSDRAKETGIEIAKKALASKISKVVFDRGGFLYAGQIKAVADAAREGGLTF